ncbi:hypothetical protein B0H67DRAFT_238417 [Lasiosphaeris hirsuta]|uniref:Uncharacterized protein n=1 Tax=Lasiosphaeris hirsuta TaxID=260670 RepID=A0AA40AG82_9PEZI|nr:hypothetical protein B0H67DRAFT_238417 [Lasiosphaeris hirsuta]
MDAEADIVGSALATVAGGTGDCMLFSLLSSPLCVWPPRNLVWSGWIQTGCVRPLFLLLFQTQAGDRRGHSLKNNQTQLQKFVEDEHGGWKGHYCGPLLAVTYNACALLFFFPLLRRCICLFLPHNHGSERVVRERSKRNRKKMNTGQVKKR